MIKKTKFIVVALVFLLSLIYAYPFAEYIEYNGEKYYDGEIITVSGFVSMVGNEPFTQIVIATKQGIQFILPEKYKNNYKEIMGKEVFVIGELELKVLVGIDNKSKLVKKFIHPIDFSVAE